MAEFPPSQGFKDELATHVATSGWEIEVGTLPKSPDRVIMISDTGGLEANPKWLLDFPSVQVMVRGGVNDYLASFREIKAVKDIMLGLGSKLINLDQWVSVTLGSDVTHIGRDENSRPLFTVNFRLIIEPQLVANSNRLAL